MYTPEILVIKSNITVACNKVPCSHQMIQILVKFLWHILNSLSDFNESWFNGKARTCSCETTKK